MIIHNILKENTFVIIVYKLLVQQKYKKTVSDCFKINGKQITKMPKKVNMLDSNVYYDWNMLCYKIDKLNKNTIYHLCRFRKCFSDRK